MLEALSWLPDLLDLVVLILGAKEWLPWGGVRLGG